MSLIVPRNSTAVFNDQDMVKYLRNPPTAATTTRDVSKWSDIQAAVTAQEAIQVDAATQTYEDGVRGFVYLVTDSEKQKDTAKWAPSSWAAVKSLCIRTEDEFK